MKIKLDERNNACPIPVVNTKKAILEASEGDTIEVKVNDLVKLENIKRLCSTLNCPLSVNKNAEDDIDLIIEVKKSSKPSSVCEVDKSNDFIVVVSSSFMGVGEEMLGKNLLKAFFFALTKQDELPDKIIFYNGGAFLTCKGSEVLDSLRELEKAGVEIYTCGTCLDYYKLKESLEIGQISNMYDIVGMQEKAGKIIKP